MEAKQTKSAAQKVSDFENYKDNRNAVLAYRMWMSMSEAEQNRAWAQWNQYYEACAVSDAAAIWETAKTSFKARDFKSFKEAVQAARELRNQGNFIPQPQCIDPFWYFHDQGIFSYRKLKEEALKEQKSQKQNDVGGIFA